MQYLDQTGEDSVGVQLSCTVRFTEKKEKQNYITLPLSKLTLRRRNVQMTDFETEKLELNFSKTLPQSFQ